MTLMIVTLMTGKSLMTLNDTLGESINRSTYFIYIYIGAVVIDKIIFPAAYMQLETPSEVAIAVRMLIAI